MDAQADLHLARGRCVMPDGDAHTVGKRREMPSRIGLEVRFQGPRLRADRGGCQMRALRRAGAEGESKDDKACAGRKARPAAGLRHVYLPRSLRWTDRSCTSLGPSLSRSPNRRATS